MKKYKLISLIACFIFSSGVRAQDLASDFYKLYGYQNGIENTPASVKLSNSFESITQDRYTTKLLVNGTQVRIYEDHSNDCKEKNEKCVFYYTPFYYFAQDSDKIKVTRELRDHNITKLTLYLSNGSNLVENIIVGRLNKMFKKTFSIDNLRVLPITDIMIFTKQDVKLADGKNYKYIHILAPNLTGDYETPDLVNETLSFEIPTDVSSDILKKITNGIRFNIIFTWLNIDAFGDTVERNIKESLYTSFEVTVDTAKLFVQEQAGAKSAN